MEHKFSIGEKVTVMGGMDHSPSAIRVIEKISPKRGDITLENYHTTFDDRGWSRGDRWNRVSIEPWKQEHSDILKKKHVRFVITSVDLKFISEEDANKLYEILKPYHDKKKAEEKKV